MDLRLLSQIDAQLDSLEVAALCFLCRDAVSPKSREGITDARGLFKKLHEKRLLENSSFLSQLLHTIHRKDLLCLLEADSSQPEETDARPLLSEYRVMLYKLYENLDREDLKKLKFLLSDQLGRRQIELCKTVLDVFTEMEKKGLLSNTKLDKLHSVLKEVDQRLAATVHDFMQPLRVVPRGPGTPPPAVMSMPVPVRLAVPETQSRGTEQNVSPDAESIFQSSPPADDNEYYALIHNPRGLCVVFNNETFLPGANLPRRGGTMEDQKRLRSVFTKFGFTVQVHNDFTAEAILRELKRLGKRDFMNEDALVVCVLSHGLKGCIFGTDGEEVSLQDFTQPFVSSQAPTLAGKPKLFFIQACQGEKLQKGYAAWPPRPEQEMAKAESQLEEDAGPVKAKVVADGADFLIGMATVEDYKSFRNTKNGSIYIQELCNQLQKSAESPGHDHILDILTRVNREVSKESSSLGSKRPSVMTTTVTLAWARRLSLIRLS
uniref:Caspase-8 n=1 Tax=Takifugu rubripes TaxID=31033 RepID=H2TIG9_TAKRU